MGQEHGDDDRTDQATDRGLGRPVAVGIGPPLEPAVGDDLVVQLSCTPRRLVDPGGQLETSTASRPTPQSSRTASNGCRSAAELWVRATTVRWREALSRGNSVIRRLRPRRGRSWSRRCRWDRPLVGHVPKWPGRSFRAPRTRLRPDRPARTRRPGRIGTGAGVDPGPTVQGRQGRGAQDGSPRANASGSGRGRRRAKAETSDLPVAGEGIGGEAM